MSDGVSVCITAYKAKDYIKECLDSVIKQTWFKTHDNWEIIVGIDGCNETLEYMKTIMGNYKNLKVLMMDSNKGTYITSNTIMSYAKYDNLFRFDSDDIMKSSLVETILNKKGESVLLKYYFKNFGGNTKVGVGHGTIYISRNVFLKYGGYRTWPCGADSELYRRLKNVENVKTIYDILMLRRVHPESLTNNEVTGMKTELRKQYQKIVKEMNVTTPEEAIIQMVTNTYKEITVDINPDTQKEYVDSLIKSAVPEKIYHFKSVTPHKKSRIETLRDDIAAGRVVKVPLGNGYVWRKVK